MIKLFGMILIFAGSTGLGLTMAKELDLRIAELSQLQQLMIRLQGEIRYMHQPLPEAFLHLSTSTVQPFSGFFRQTAEDLQTRSGRTAEDIWRENLKICVQGLHISRQEYQELEKLGSMLGCLDVEMQINTLDYYLDQLKQSSLRASETSRSRRRLYQYLGVLGGAALVILII